MSHPTNISTAELDVLKVLWDHGPSTVRDVLDHATDKDWAYTTAQTLLARLVEKGFVERIKDGRAFTFRPLVGRNELLGAELDEIAVRICEGQSMPLLLNLVHSERLAPGDLKRLRDLIDELDDEVQP